MKLNYKRTFFIGLAFMSICAFWQLYDYVVPYILQYTFALPESVTGAVMAADNLLALFLLPLFGSLSDKINTRLGRRTPFILVGTAAAVILMILVPYADWTRNLPLFIISLALLLLAMASYRSPAVALMPDLTPKPLRSGANAVINLMGALGGIFTYGIIILMLPKIDIATGEKAQSYIATFGVVAAFMAAAVIIFFLTIRERKLADAMPPEEETADEANPGAGIRLAPEVRRSLIFILLSVAMWYIAYNAISSAYSRYVLEVWGISEGTGATMMLVATVVTTASYIPVGIISARIGRKKMILIGVTAMTLAYLSAFFFTSYHFAAYIVMAVIGIGWAAINVNSYPMVVEMSSGADVGRYTGIYYTFSMSAQIITPMLSGLLIQLVGYRVLFPYAVFFSAMAFVTMTQVRHGDVRPSAKKSALEYLDTDD
ncbi:MAG: SLC45 family MFS transporter [Ruminococcaceae bacterium]|nr:SLC45 family MFS transporter [Oscillospiraceae bacterium]